MGPAFDFKDHLGDARIARWRSCKTEGCERGMKVNGVGLINQSPSTLLQLILAHRNTAITQGVAMGPVLTRWWSVSDGITATAHERHCAQPLPRRQVLNEKSSASETAIVVATLT